MKIRRTHGFLCLLLLRLPSPFSQQRARMERKRSSLSSSSSRKKELPSKTTSELLSLWPPTGKTRSKAAKQEQQCFPFKCTWILDWRRRGAKPSAPSSHWLHDQMNRAATMERFLNTRCLLDRLIDEQLNRYESRSNRSSSSFRPSKVAGELMPEWRFPLENALNWFGDWRPSAIFTLLFHFIRASRFRLSPRQINILNRFRRDTRIEEAILDEELGDYQATCIIRLSFAGVPAGFGENWAGKTETALPSVQSGLKKIDRVVARAQQLRYRVLELIVKKVLDRTDASEFLVAFAGIQNMVHRFASSHRITNGPVCIAMENFAS